MKAVGTDQLGRYNNPTLLPSQTKEVADYTAEQTAAGENFYKEAGMPSSDQQVAFFKNLGNDTALLKYDMTQAIKEDSWIKAMQTLGLSEEAATKLAQFHDQQRKETSAIFSGLLGAIGTVVGGIYGGPGGAVAGGTVGTGLGKAIPV